ncbi:unnamed protein product [Gongylonema pulchrum]|uniref:Secreted protein n=1 Tax=Gongylonema pulchrum TaxID=637853 RepID=A0A183D406_9BILA|nr:unnamed protein product [Gongylonema pulchrum]
MQCQSSALRSPSCGGRRQLIATQRRSSGTAIQRIALLLLLLLQLQLRQVTERAAFGAGPESVRLRPERDRSGTRRAARRI